MGTGVRSTISKVQWRCQWLTEEKTKNFKKEIETQKLRRRKKKDICERKMSDKTPDESAKLLRKKQRATKIEESTMDGTRGSIWFWRVRAE